MEKAYFYVMNILWLHAPHAFAILLQTIHGSAYTQSEMQITEFAQIACFTGTCFSSWCIGTVNLQSVIILLLQLAWHHLGPL